MTLAFIVRVELDGQRHALTLQDLETGERRDFEDFDACFAALRERALVRERAPTPARPRAPVRARARRPR